MVPSWSAVYWLTVFSRSLVCSWSLRRPSAADGLAQLHVGFDLPGCARAQIRGQTDRTRLEQQHHRGSAQLEMALASSLRDGVAGLEALPNGPDGECAD